MLNIDQLPQTTGLKKDNRPEPGRMYLCPECGFEILPMFEYMTLWALRAGGMIQTEAHGLCINCGGRVHFRISEQRLQRLLEMVTEGTWQES